MNALEVFTYGENQLHAVDIDGAPWFFAADVARILGLANLSSSVALLDEDERGLHTMETPSGVQQVTVVSEPGLYSMILRSRRQEAKAFKRWVTHDVIPSIRRAGSYSIPAQRAETIPAVPQSYKEALIHLLAKVEENEALTRELETSKAQVAVMAPAAEAWGELVDGEGDYLVGDAAKMLSRVDGISTGQNRLYRYLSEQGLVYRANGDSGPWRAYQAAVERGWLVERVTTGYHVSKGEVVNNPPQVRVTVKGLERLRALMIARALPAPRGR